MVKGTFVMNANCMSVIDLQHEVRHHYKPAHHSNTHYLMDRVHSFLCCPENRRWA